MNSAESLNRTYNKIVGSLYCNSGISAKFVLMKNWVFILVVSTVVAVSCSKKEPQDLYPADSPKANYDTVAVDSFSSGATSVDVVRQIRISSKKYQDSLKEALKLQEQEQKIQQELEKENKQKAEEEKKQNAAEKAPAAEAKTE